MPDPHEPSILNSSLQALHQELLSFIGTLLSDFPESQGVAAYFYGRSQHKLAVRQDLLPLPVYTAISNQSPSAAMPLTAAWALHLAAAHLVDFAQDQGSMHQVHQSILAMSAANVALADLDADRDTLCDLLDAMGRVAAMSVSAQGDELAYGRTWTRTAYFRSIAGKAAAIIATGAWMGGRLATDDEQILTAMQEFGLALGMSIQISDDCLDLAEDLANGTFTLPVIEGLALDEHPAHSTLKQLLTQQPITSEDTQEIMQILEQMGVMAKCKKIIRAYQIQVEAAFTLFPSLELYFASYVAAQSET